MMQVAGTTLEQSLDDIFGKRLCGQVQATDVDQDLDLPDFEWDGDSTTTIDFAAANDKPKRSLGRHDSVVSVASATPCAFEGMSPLALEVGCCDNGRIIPNIQGACIKLGRETLVRMCIRCILCLPAEDAVVVCEKNVKTKTHYVSTTFSGSDGIMEARAALVVACHLLLGRVEQYPPLPEEIHCRLEQTVAAEIDPHRVRFLISKQQYMYFFQKINAISRDHNSCMW